MCSYSLVSYSFINTSENWFSRLCIALSVLQTSEIVGLMMYVKEAPDVPKPVVMKSGKNQTQPGELFSVLLLSSCGHFVYHTAMVKIYNICYLNELFIREQCFSFDVELIL